MKMVVWGIAVAILGVMSAQLFRIIVDDSRVSVNLDRKTNSFKAILTIFPSRKILSRSLKPSLIIKSRAKN
ncbi:MAG: hypothetical protein UY14_C0035G0009 [Parcubacteria group bacterium GW2011_GWA1_47_9]|nr:MAG: hypothetical protein UY14_C0035G0009 [Parcubacteria group bacterium GW2011_GWA1_47_9]